MVPNSSDQGSVSRSPKKPSVKPPVKSSPKNYYFKNEIVEELLYQYLETECTHVGLRDEIMSHASELIRQVIRAHNLQSIYQGRDDASFYDLFQVAWVQIESTLYKYEALPHCLYCFNKNRPLDSIIAEEFMFFSQLCKKIKTCPNCKNKIAKDKIYYKGRSKVFNMWSQIARTVILAYLKRDSRDRKNYTGYHTFLTRTYKEGSQQLERFLTELRELCKYSDEHQEIIESIEKLYENDDRPHEGLISKLVQESGKSRAQINSFLRFVRLRSYELTDSPLNQKQTKRFTDGKDDDED